MQSVVVPLAMAENDTALGHVVVVVHFKYAIPLVLARGYDLFRAYERR